MGYEIPSVVVYLRHLHHHSTWVGRIQWARKWTDSDALTILMSEPTAKTNVKRTRVFVLSLVTLHYIHYINVYLQAVILD